MLYMLHCMTPPSRVQVGEVRIQFHVVTDGHDQMEQQIQAFNHTMNTYGFPGVRLFWTDNAAADFAFFQRVIPSLAQTQAELDNKTAVPARPTNDAVPECSVSASCYQVLSDADIDAKLRALRDTVKLLPPESRVLGLDAEWDTTTGRNGMVSATGKVALIQISYKLAVDSEIHALLVRVHGKHDLPPALLALLADPDLTFTGRNVGGDLRKIGLDLQCSRHLQNVNIVELGRMARERDVVHSGAVGLDTIVRQCLGECLNKTAGVRLSKWSAQTLSPQQQQYAALDVIKSLEVYFKLVHMPNLSLRLSSSAQPGTEVDIVPAHGAVHVMATRAGTGKILSPNHQWTLPGGFKNGRKPRGDMQLVQGIACAWQQCSPAPVRVVRAPAHIRMCLGIHTSACTDVPAFWQ
jgi:hypothetical protein